MAIAIYAANGEEGPARWVPRLGRDAIRAGLEEIDLILWRAAHCAGEDYEELENDASSEQDQGDQPEYWSYWGQCVKRRLM